MTSIKRGFLFILVDTSIKALFQYVEKAYCTLLEEGETKEVLNMYSNAQIGHSLEECYIALENIQARAGQGKEAVAALRADILRRIHELVD